MRRSRLIIIGVCYLLILLNLLCINYLDLISKSNLGPFLGITSLMFTILAIFFSNRYESEDSN